MEREQREREHPALLAVGSSPLPAQRARKQREDGDHSDALDHERSLLWRIRRQPVQNTVKSLTSDESAVIR